MIKKFFKLDIKAGLLQHFAFRNDSMCKNVAFTLAEVLITLGIIGVVAALTLPVLSKIYTNHITEVRLKKFYSDFSNAIRLSEAEYGDIATWSDLWVLNSNDQNTDNPENIKIALEKYIGSHMKISAAITSGNSYVFELPDGSAFSFPNNFLRTLMYYPKNWKNCRQSVNAHGIQCAFFFSFVDEGTKNYWTEYGIEHGSGYGGFEYANGRLQPYIYDWDGTEDGERGILTHPEKGCNTSSSSSLQYCTMYIKNNGWKIPKDYPAKIKY